MSRCAWKGRALALAAMAVLLLCSALVLGGAQRALATEGDDTGGTAQPVEEQEQPVVAEPLKTSIVKLRPGSRQVDVTWKKTGDPTVGYQVRYSTKKNMAGAKSETVGSADENSLEIGKLRAFKRYYVQVRTIATVDGGRRYSPWSAKKSAKTSAFTRDELVSALDSSSKSKAVKTINSSYKLGKTKAGKKLLRQVKKMRKRYKINFVMIDVKSGEGLSCSPSRYMYSASCLKGPYVASLNQYKPKSRSSAGRMRQTVIPSNNETYASLRRSYGSSSMAKLMKQVKVKSISPGRWYGYLPTRDLGKLWVGTYWYFYKDTNKNSKWCRSLYTHGTQSFIYTGMRGKSKVHAKPGWYPGGGFNVQNDAGVVMARVDGESRPYVLAVMTSACGQFGQLRQLVRCIDAVHADMTK